MASFNYEWWNVKIRFTNGTFTYEVKAKSKEHAIRQIEKDFKFTNSEKNLSKPFWERQAPMVEVFWDTLELDRVGYQSGTRRID